MTDYYAILNRKDPHMGDEKVAEYKALQEVAKGDVEKGVEYAGEPDPTKYSQNPATAEEEDDEHDEELADSCLPVRDEFKNKEGDA